VADYDRSPRVSLAVPVFGLVALAFTWGRTDLSGPILIVVGLLLAGSVIAAVLHAETLAHRVGEPYGSLLLALAVTVIEVGLIVTLMLGGKPGSEAVARDTVFAAVMICTTVIIGLSLLIGALREGSVSFRSEGPVAAVAAVATLATLSLSSRPSPRARRGRRTPPRSWCSRPSPRSACTCCSCWCRRSATPSCS
jgi:Ca2+:H+ antiporter